MKFTGMNNLGENFLSPHVNTVGASAVHAIRAAVPRASRAKAVRAGAKIAPVQALAEPLLPLAVARAADVQALVPRDAEPIPLLPPSDDGGTRIGLIP